MPLWSLRKTTDKSYLISWDKVPSKSIPVRTGETAHIEEHCPLHKSSHASSLESA
jgi:hypothetical protein